MPSKPFAATVAAVSLMLVAGCASGHTRAAAASSRIGAGSGDTLLTLPDQGESTIYRFITSARSSLDMTMYELNDTTAERDLATEARAGVRVRVVLDGKQRSKNQPAYDYLSGHGVGVVWSSSDYQFTHQKTLTVDGRESLILTGNLDSTYYAGDRDYGVFDSDANDVAAIEKVFDADYAHTAVTPGDGDDLVWSPTDSQTQLVNLIDSARRSLVVEQEESGDRTLINALISAEQRGVRVTFVGEDESGYESNFTRLVKAGAKVATYDPRDSSAPYIHAKAIVADQGDSDQAVFLGSENWSNTSLNENRELGLIISNPTITNAVATAANRDYGAAAEWTR